MPQSISDSLGTSFRVKLGGLLLHELLAAATRATVDAERERDEQIRKLEKEMQEASKMLEFEYAAILRDRIIELRKEEKK